MRALPLALLLIAAAVPAAARPLTVRMGETLLFTVVRGQPANARRVAAIAKPAAGELKVSLQPLMGTTLTITNNGRFDYAYRAIAILPGGRAAPAKSCAVPANGRLAIEHWPRAVAAIRLRDFRPAPAGSLCP